MVKNCEIELNLISIIQVYAWGRPSCCLEWEANKFFVENNIKHYQSKSQRVAQTLLKQQFGCHALNCAVKNLLSIPDKYQQALIFCNFFIKKKVIKKMPIKFFNLS